MTHIGTYAGEYQEEAIEILFEDEDYAWVDESWADIMIDRFGQIVAVKCDGALTDFNCSAVVAELTEKDFHEYYKIYRDNYN